MLTCLVAGLMVAAPPRLITELESVQRAGIVPVTDPNAVPDPEGRVALESNTVFEWALFPSLEGRMELRNHQLSIQYAPRILTQLPFRQVDRPIVYHAGQANHVWSFAPGMSLESNLEGLSGEVDIIQASTQGGFGRENLAGSVPGTGIFVQNRFGGSVGINAAAGDLDEFRISFVGEYSNPGGVETEDDIGFAPVYTLGFNVNYSRQFLPLLAGVIRTEMRHIDFFEEDRQIRVAVFRAGFDWQSRRRLRFTLTGGGQFTVGQLRDLQDATRVVNTSELLPSANLGVSWVFIRNNLTNAELLFSTSLDGFVDQADGRYFPQVSGSLGVVVNKPWGDFEASGLFGTPLPGQADSQSTALLTSYSISARLTLPTSAYFGVYFEGRVSERGPPLDSDDFEFLILDATGVVGLRFWWSSGRDDRLRRPSETLNTRSG